MSRIRHTDLVIFNVFQGITFTSQYIIDIMESYVVLVSIIFLFTLTGITLVLYYKRLKGAKAKYEEAREVVGDVVVSFNKQLQRQEELLEKASYRIEGLSSKSDNLVTKVEEFGKQTGDLASRVSSTSETQDRLMKDMEDVRAMLNEVRRVHEEMQKQISGMPEAKIEAVIPIKREHALAPLTETELRVLEFIAEVGEKTAPEIRNLTKLTREHSARLVKKLYEEGYLERETGKTPYRYRVKDEMLKILRKSESQA